MCPDQWNSCETINRKQFTDISGSGSGPLADDRPALSRSEKQPLESISAAKERAMELEEIMEEGIENTPVS